MIYSSSTLLYNSRSFERQFDVVDLDPYGSASPFVDGALQAVKVRRDHVLQIVE